MKRLAAVLLALALSVGLAGATPYYVDPSCSTSGDGTTTTCGTNGPVKTINEGIGKLSSSGGDTLRIKGGRYLSDYANGGWFRVTGKIGSLTSQTTIEPYNYSTTPDVVYLDGTRTDKTWSACWSGGTCTCDAGLSSTICQETFYVTGTDVGTDAQKPDGSPTYRVGSLAELTNAHSAYKGAVCSTQTWKHCDYTRDCKSGETCTATSSEIDSYWVDGGGGGNANTLYVRWGSSVPSGAAFFDNTNGNGNAFFVDNDKYVTIRGFIARCHERPAFVVINDNGDTENITIDHNESYYNIGAGGHDYGAQVGAVAGYTAAYLALTNNTFAYDGSEVHADVDPAGGASLPNMRLNSNYSRNIGDWNVIGSATIGGTPAGYILGCGCAPADCPTGCDYHDTTVNSNLIERSTGTGIILENGLSGTSGHPLVVSNNRITNNNGSGLRSVLSSKAASGDGSGYSQYVDIFNNLLDANGPADSELANLDLLLETSNTTMDHYNVFNNTIVNGANRNLYVHGVNAASNTFSNLTFRNNLSSDTSSSHKAIEFLPNGATVSGVVLQYSLAYTPSTGTVVDWNGKQSTCAQVVTSADVDNDSVGYDYDQCASPSFISSTDFHIGSASPAKDTGTSTGMPSGRTVDWYILLSAAHGLTDYATTNDNATMQGSAWDIGADEYKTTGGGGHCCQEGPTGGGDQP